MYPSFISLISILFCQTGWSTSTYSRENIIYFKIFYSWGKTDALCIRYLRTIGTTNKLLFFNFQVFPARNEKDDEPLPDALLLSASDQKMNS